MIVALAPHGVVKNPQRLQRLAEGSRRVRGHAGQRIGQRIVAGGAGCGLVAAGQFQHRVDGRAHGVLLRSFAQLFTDGQQADVHHGGVVRREVADVAQLVDVMSRGNRLPLRVGIDHRQVGHGAGEGDELAGEQIRRFHCQRLLQAQRRAGHVRQILVAIAQRQIPRQRNPRGMVTALPHEVPERGDPFGHDRELLSIVRFNFIDFRARVL